MKQFAGRLDANLSKSRSSQCLGSDQSRHTQKPFVLRFMVLSYAKCFIITIISILTTYFILYTHFIIVCENNTKREIPVP